MFNFLASKKDRFSRFVKSYDLWAIPQKNTAEVLAYFIILFEEKQIRSKTFLDLGSGTGFLSDFLIKAYPFIKIEACDISASAIEVYKKKYNRPSYCMDVSEIQSHPHNYDCIVSNFSFHWFSHYKDILEKLKNKASRFYFSFPIQNSLEDFKFPFLKKEEFFLYLKKANFKILFFKEEKVFIPYRGMDLLKYFHYTGTSLYMYKKRSGLLSPNSFKKRVEKELSQKDFFYNILYILFTKDS